jgi:hypothetical protein
VYNKLFTKILDSSVWLAPDPHRLVWITLIAAMDQDGFAAFACAANVASRARVTIHDATEALKAFELPDPYGEEQEYQGRRIERMQGGWLVLNAQKYRSIITRAVASDQSRLRMQRYRERKLRNVTQPLHPVTPSDMIRSDHMQSNTTAAKPQDFPELRALYPLRAGSNPWPRAIKAVRARLKDGATIEDLIAGLQRYASFIRATGKERTEYVMQAATFFGPDKGFAEPWGLPTTKAETRLDANIDVMQQFVRGAT